jgi:hypothetical protein
MRMCLIPYLTFKCFTRLKSLSSKNALAYLSGTSATMKNISPTRVDRKNALAYLSAILAAKKKFHTLGPCSY